MPRGPVLETATCQSLGGWRRADRALGLPVALLGPPEIRFLRPRWAHTPDALTLPPALGVGGPVPAAVSGPGVVLTSRTRL